MRQQLHCRIEAVVVLVAEDAHQSSAQSAVAFRVLQLSDDYIIRGNTAMGGEEGEGGEQTEAYGKGVLFGAMRLIVGSE